MSNLNDNQIAELKKPLDPSRVKHRAGGGGMQLAYLKGHNVIDQANDIFGFGGWGYDILMVELCNVVGESGEVIGGYYAARVRLQVRDCMPITEEGVCPIQEGRNPRARIDAHDMARKGAVTDAMKRAFRCYGDQFGNSLYDTDLVDGQPGTEKVPAQPYRQQAPAPAPSRPVTPGLTRMVNTMPHTSTSPQNASKPPVAVTQPSPNVVAASNVATLTKASCPKHGDKTIRTKMVTTEEGPKRMNCCLEPFCDYMVAV